ncbi:lytic transglycosylase domain-containing protein [Clostridium thailandense]|uniref:Lytic transglycosylase domain-containing protein n=1 Tax=Clostridium thailandense TaxID=2794346 RepID=A0A949TWE6_9CLOT|nr:lytic transglycosylase domain-containing protein [Clostridium thailandense]MBV7273091.1 lytic transglycosylase domain-containing protein [Clostridium thailandense]MCH5135755.1 lytic transglycosylase domain-containing protein [Clostridiaceae bacterium UIB06]
MKIIRRVLLFIVFVVLIMNVKNIVKEFFPYKYSNYIVKYSQTYALDPYLVAAVIKTESNFQEGARSNKNAYGLMQITPDTAEWAAEKMEVKNFSVTMLNDPEFNIRMGCWYLNNLREEFDGNMELVLAAYNGGRGNVQKWLKSSDHSADGKNLHYIPFKETDKYVKKVKVNYSVYKYLYDKEEKKSIGTTIDIAYQYFKLIN